MVNPHRTSFDLGRRLLIIEGPWDIAEPMSGVTREVFGQGGAAFLSSVIAP